LRLQFEDEARFGRMSDSIRCWAPAGVRPQAATHRVRQYTHVFGSVCPHDGELISLIPPHADTAATAAFRAEREANLEKLELPKDRPVKIWVADEARCGLHRQSRRCWALRGQRVVLAPAQR
jgi:hypothetical protein